MYVNNDKFITCFTSTSDIEENMIDHKRAVAALLERPCCSGPPIKIHHFMTDDVNVPPPLGGIPRLGNVALGCK